MESASSNGEEFPVVPNDASEIYEDLSFRDKQRKQAIDIARARADAATSDDEREYYIQLAGIMSDVRFELHELFPEVFDD